MTQSVTDVQTLLPELAQLVVSAVNLEVDPASIDPDAPLYREGLGLDSIDALELGIALRKKFGVRLEANDSENARHFRSVDSLASLVQSLS